MKRLNPKKIIFIGIILISFIFAISFIYYRYFINRPNIILITIDALRPDHLSCYGYQRNTSPNIDKLAEEGVTFLNCFATSNYTFSATPALFTGKYLIIFGEIEDMLKKNNILDKQFTTLAEYLKNAGYFTTAFFNHEPYRLGTGFEQGFDIYIQTALGSKTITDKVIHFLNNYHKKPFFIWVPYLDTHAPYIFSEEHLKFFENDKLYKESDRMLMLGSSSNLYDSKGYIPPVVFRKDKYNLNYYIACYDAAIRSTDFYIGELLKNIKDNTLIILTADHGEYLGEHNVYFTHGGGLCDVVLHIPLIIRDNGYFKGGKKILKIVSSVDVVPTILNRINPVWYFFNKSRFDGKDLKEIVNGRDIKRKYIYSYTPLKYNIRDVNKNIKYILDKDGKEVLYFLPDEYTNYVNDDSLRVTSIKEELRKDLKNGLRIILFAQI